MRVRRFNDRGCEAFRAELQRLRADPGAAPRRELLQDPGLTEEVPGTADIDARALLPTKREAAEYLRAALDGAGATQGVLADANLWAWLSLFLFDSVCPAKDGKRKVRVDENYIPRLDLAFRRYRHLLRTPYLIHVEVPPPNRILLDAPLATQGDVVEQMLGRLFLMRVRPLREAIDLLYFDEERGAVREGAVSGRVARPGDLRHRFPVRVQQLRLVYDLESMPVERLLDVLGDEFRAWCPVAAAHRSAAS